MMLLLIGLAAGAHGLGLLSPAILSFVDPAMPVALVALGTLLGLRVRIRRPGGWRARAAASTGALATMAVVFGGIVFVVPEWGAGGSLPYWFLPLAVAIGAASSAADEVLPVVAGGVALALLREPSPMGALLLLLQACGVAVVIAAAWWLLLTKSRSETEQRIFTIATLLLLGGVADYLSLSALLSGLVAGICLDLAGGPARDFVRRDILHVQHPLLALVLVVTGARVEPAYPWLGLAAAYLGLAFAGDAAGRWLAARLADMRLPAGDVTLLSPGGVLGIAFALNVLRAAGPDAAPALTVVAIGAIGVELIAAMSGRREAALA
ncbi:MAG: hypothetical protein FJW14_12290 [Acidimicrobiia bacterium]|nr:hypothetical protein [Acidimicrobiia bacterium]